MSEEKTQEKEVKEQAQPKKQQKYYRTAKGKRRVHATVPRGRAYIHASLNNTIVSITDQNEIGIWVLKKFQNMGIGGNALKLLIKHHPKSRYLANINPKNLKSTKFFKKFGFKLIQHTYELTTDEP